MSEKPASSPAHPKPNHQPAHGQPASSAAVPAPRAEAPAASKIPATEFPAGLSTVLPGGDFAGTLVPYPKLVFDPPPSSVVEALKAPTALRVTWPIKGTVKHLHGIEMECNLAWKVVREKANPLARAEGAATDGTASAPEYGDPTATPVAQETSLKIDSGGHFEILVDKRPPVLDFLDAAIVTRGKVGFDVMLAALPDTPVQGIAPTVEFDVPCTVEVTCGTDLRLGDQIVFTPSFHEVLNQAELELRVTEDDVGIEPTSKPVALIRDVSGRSDLKCRWTIGFALGEESTAAMARFGYTELNEVGDFEYSWALRGRIKNEDHEPTVLLASATPFKVQKPFLAALDLKLQDAEKHLWAVSGTIEGFSTAETLPPIRVLVMLVDKQGKTYPATVDEAPLATLDAKGSFEQEITGPAVDIPVPLPADFASPVFGIMALAGTWNQDGKSPGPIEAFLGFNDEHHALFKTGKGTGYAHDAEWVTTKEADDLAPRGARPKDDRVAAKPPGPQAGGDQFARELPLDELFADTLPWEQSIPYLYRDHEGYMTIGVGNCLVTQAEPESMTATLALLPKLKNRDNGKPAKKEDVELAFTRILHMPFGKSYPADSFRTHPHLEMEAKDIRELWDQRANSFLEVIRGFLTDFDTYPKAARRALFDVAYAGGPACYKIRKYPGVTEAVLQRDWGRLGQVLRTVQARPERYQWRKELLDYATQMDATRGQK